MAEGSFDDEDLERRRESSPAARRSHGASASAGTPTSAPGPGRARRPSKELLLGPAASSESQWPFGQLMAERKAHLLLRREPAEQRIKLRAQW